MAKNLGVVEVAGAESVEFADLEIVNDQPLKSDDKRDSGGGGGGKGRMSASDYLLANPISAEAQPLLANYDEIAQVAKRLGETFAQLDRMKEIYRGHYAAFMASAPKMYDLFNCNLTEKRRPAFLTGSPKIATADSSQIVVICEQDCEVEIRKGEVIFPVYMLAGLWDQNLNLTCGLPEGDKAFKMQLDAEKVRAGATPFSGQVIWLSTKKTYDPSNPGKWIVDLRVEMIKRARDLDPNSNPSYDKIHDLVNACAADFLNGIVRESNARVALAVEAHNYMKNLLALEAGWTPKLSGDKTTLVGLTDPSIEKDAYSLE